jgi:putative N-acetyltransferase (TIGR04045 family)
VTGLRSRPGAAPVEIRIAASAADLEGHHRARHRVFVEEQGIFAGSDRDMWDDLAIHVVAARGPLVVGSVRLYPLDEAGLWQGDRLAVLREARRLRAGGPLVRFAVRTAGERGGRLMIAQVQQPNVAFFLHLGWSSVGEPADYHGVAHQRMCIPLAGADEAFSPAGYAWALGG